MYRLMKPQSEHQIVPPPKPICVCFPGVQILKECLSVGETWVPSRWDYFKTQKEALQELRFDGIQATPLDFSRGLEFTPRQASDLSTRCPCLLYHISSLFIILVEN